MHFQFEGRRRLVVGIAKRTLVKNGQPAAAKIDVAGGRIWLSDQLAKHERRKKLFHELRHAWTDARGPTVDTESDADDASEMMMEVMDQYLAQGGDAVLESLVPESEALGAKAAGAMMMAQTECACGYCGARIALGSIGGDGPIWSPDLHLWLTDRGMWCETCDCVTCWREICTPEGMPLGQAVAHPPPRVLKGKEAGQWINEHQTACRVLGV